ncbi:hypothetical protein [Bacteroides salyersiae]|jgi:hypothetical protein|uniref:hypothetical protein n=1 Tax=Bacteroides salyersiae TaxID=291644 RepID=UPI00101D7312|nr:hypothetical protein [Bacteroides salyersiae]DAE60915.1 MAG TPA: Nif11 domain [Caudoviricetes sp.]
MNRLIDNIEDLETFLYKVKNKIDNSDNRDIAIALKSALTSISRYNRIKRLISEAIGIGYEFTEEEIEDKINELTGE